MSNNPKGNRSQKKEDKLKERKNQDFSIQKTNPNVPEKDKRKRKSKDQNNNEKIRY